jgi:hypothetical protein
MLGGDAARFVDHETNWQGLDAAVKRSHVRVADHYRVVDAFGREADSNRGAKEPSFRVIGLSLLISRQSEEHFDSEFLGPGGIADDSYDNGRNAPVVGAKKRLQVKSASPVRMSAVSSPGTFTTG